jgi:SAM-dependent methyltransferase
LILDFLRRVIHKQGGSVLDVGAGFGRWGFLLRCHLADGISLTVAAPQRLRVDAVEIHAPNVSPLYQCVYDRTFVGDARAVLPTLGQYDVVITSHVLEHFPKDVGQEVLAQLVSRATVAAVISVPFGDWPQGEVHGNVHEAHLATWQPRDFRHFRPYIKSFGCFGVVIIPRSDEARWQVRMKRSPVRRMAFRLLKALEFF